QGLRKRRHVARLEAQAPDPAPDLGDAGLALDAAAVVELGHQSHGGRRRGEHASPRAEHLARPVYGAVETALELAERGEDEVAEAVTGHVPAPVEPVAEERSHRRIAVREGEETVPDVSRRQHAVRLAQAARAAAVVGDGDDR